MATAPPPIKLSGLARSLIQEKLLSEEEAQAIQTQANAAKNPFITQLILSKKLNPQVIAKTSAQAFGLPYLNLDAFDEAQLPTKQIDPNLMQVHRVMGLQVRNNVLFVAVSDPTNLHALDSVQFLMGMSLSPVVVEDDKLGQWIAKLVERSDTSMQSFDLTDDAFGVLNRMA
ncbi:Type II secretion system protein GspE, N-terminal [Methylophilaceae bacterium]